MPILETNDPSKPLTLLTDASTQELGVMIYLGEVKEQLVLAYSSQMLLPEKILYHIMEKDALTIIWDMDSN